MGKGIPFPEGYLKVPVGTVPLLVKGINLVRPILMELYHLCHHLLVSKFKRLNSKDTLQDIRTSCHLPHLSLNCINLNNLLLCLLRQLDLTMSLSKRILIYRHISLNHPLLLGHPFLSTTTQGREGTEPLLPLGKDNSILLLSFRTGIIDPHRLIQVDTSLPL
jgi:hypothetical protein